MALRSSNISNIIAGNNLPIKKVEAKLKAGPVLRRAALGDIGNRASLIQRATRTGKSALGKPVTKSLSSVGDLKTFKVPEKSSLKGLGKENESLVPKEFAKQAEENVMEVEAETIPEKKIITKSEPLVKQTEVKENIEELSEAFSTQLLNVEDIDSCDSDNPQLVSEYVNDIYKYLRILEEDDKILENYLQGNLITPKMRTILIDWLVQVHHKFTLLQETLYLTISILDRYLQFDKTLPKAKLQLVGVTSMFIASKYEEMYCPEIGDFAYITDKAYTNIQIRKMEVKILNSLNHNVSFPLPLHFLRRNSKAGQVDATQHTLAKYLMELCLPEYAMCHYKPSIIAATALCLSIKLLDDSPDWNETLTYYSNYNESQIMPVICKMAAIVLKSNTCKCDKSKFTRLGKTVCTCRKAIKNKYKSNKLMKISLIPELQHELIVSLAQRSPAI